MTGSAWPAVLTEGPVALRPLSLRDAREWVDSRKHNVEWLRPWEATAPPVRTSGGAARPAGADVPTSYATFVTMTRRLRRDARHGRSYPFAIRYDGGFVGQLTIGGMTLGSLRSAHLGYWIDQRAAGRGIMPTAVAMATDHCFWELDLHRVEVNIRPENTPSRRVVEKLGFREEGVRVGFLHIAGGWCDHVTYALTADEVGPGLLARWRRDRDRFTRGVSDTPLEVRDPGGDSG